MTTVILGKFAAATHANFAWKAEGRDRDQKPIVIEHYTERGCISAYLVNGKPAANWEVEAALRSMVGRVTETWAVN